MKKYQKLIQSDIDTIVNHAHFNNEQEAVFHALVSPKYRVTHGNTAIFAQLGISESKFYRVKKEIDEKIDRILKES